MLRTVVDRKYAYVLLLAAIAVLAIGLVLKPGRPEAAAPSESDLAQLQRLTQQRRLRDLSTYLTDAAEVAASSLVYVRPGERSGVVWDSRPLIITTRTAPLSSTGQPWTIVTPNGRSQALTDIPFPAAVPFSAFSLTLPPRITPANRATTPPDLGDWVLVVGRNADGGVVFAHGLYQGLVAARCGSFSYRSVQSSAPVSAALLGGGAFTLDGRLLGIVSECNQTPILVANETITEVLRQPPSVNSRLEDVFGIRVGRESTSPDAGAESPLRVTAIWADSRGQAAGLSPGDVILAADGRPVHSSEDLERLLAGDAAHELTVQRGTRKITAALSQDEAPSRGAAPYGITLGEHALDRRVSVAAIVPGSSAARAGALPGDLLVRVGSTPVPDVAAALRALADTRATRVVTLERDGRQYEVLLQP